MILCNSKASFSMIGIFDFYILKKISMKGIRKKEMDKG